MKKCAFAELKKVTQFRICVILCHFVSEKVTQFQKYVTWNESEIDYTYNYKIIKL